MKRNRQMITALLFIMYFSILTAQEKPKWQHLGSRKVNFKTDKDVIKVGIKDGLFKAIKLTVHKSGVHFKDMKVHFVNGDVVDVKIRKVIPAGGETRIIDLPRKNRFIKKVVFWYESTLRNPKRSTVKLWGIE